MMNIDLLLQWLSILGWAIFIVAAVFLFWTTLRRQGIKPAIDKLFSARLLPLLLIALALSILSASVVFIQPQEVGIVISLVAPEGVRDQPLRSGLHLIVPFAEQVIRYTISWQTYTMSSKPGEGAKKGDDSIVARTSDGQEVSIDCSAIFRIDPEQALRVQIEWQERYIEDFIRPVIRGVVRTEVSGFTVDEVNSSKRKDLEANLDLLISQKFADKGLILDQFILRNIAFSPEYAASVEQKQVALQGAIQKEYEANQIRKLAAGQADAVKIKAQADADARVIQAKAEAAALKLIADILAQNSDLLTYRYIDKLSPNIKVMLVPNNSPLILPLPTMEAETITSTLATTETFSTTPLPAETPSAQPPIGTPTPTP
jgi:regulator of protease activity HflC (stomatin/prohibitin superfamily)